LAAACGGGDPAPSTGPTPQPSGITEVATNLPPRTALEEAVKAIYQREFAEPVFRPAIFDDVRSSNCAGAGHLTSAAYLPSSARFSRLLFVYTSRDGTQVIRTDTSSNVITPAGRFRVLVALLTWPETVADDTLPLWIAAQQRINDDHAAFAAAKGYAAPIVSFESTNVLLAGSEVPTPNTRAGILSALSAHGVPTTGFDFVVLVNMDPAKNEGGLAFTGSSDPAVVYVGNFSAFKTRLDAADVDAVARTVYHHEIAHHWGWPGTHDWSPTCGGVQLGFEPLIAAPVLFGWEDTDGDRIPEILDPTPYGRSR
jgi:hypothetical protein